MAFGHGLTHTAATAAYWASQSKFADTLEVNQDDGNLGCNRVNLVWTRSVPAGVREDVAVIGLAIGKIVGGGLYSKLVAADMIAAETNLDTMWTTVKPFISDGYTLTSYVWHEHMAAHPATEKGYETIGPAVRTTLKSVAGTAPNARNTDQVSTTVSLRTTSRKHWGRVYIPGISVNAMDVATGRLATGTVDGIAGAFRILHNSLNSASMQLGVWTWKRKAFLQLSEIRVDNVLDIQRRRRPKMSNYFKSYVA